MFTIIKACCFHVSHLVRTGCGGNGIFGAVSLNICTLEGAFKNIFLQFEINWSNFGKFFLVSSATLCKAWAKQVTYFIFE